MEDLLLKELKKQCEKLEDVIYMEEDEDEFLIAWTEKRVYFLVDCLGLFRWCSGFTRIESVPRNPESLFPDS